MNSSLELEMKELLRIQRGVSKKKADVTAVISEKIISRTESNSQTQMAV